MAGKLRKIQYQSDDGNIYVVRMDDSNATAIGAVTGTGRPTLPPGYRMRYVECVDDTDVTGGRVPTHARRVIQATDPTTTRWIGTLNTITLPDFSITPSAAVTFSIVGRVGEKRYAR